MPIDPREREWWRLQKEVDDERHARALEGAKASGYNFYKNETLPQARADVRSDLWPLVLALAVVAVGTALTVFAMFLDGSTTLGWWAKVVTWIFGPLIFLFGSIFVPKNLKEFVISYRRLKVVERDHYAPPRPLRY